MELVFQERKSDYLHKIFCETVMQEQTADVVIPDSLSDADRVVDTFGTLLIRTEECTSDGASVSGVVQAGVLFVGENGQLQRVETQIPFSARRDFTAQERECTLRCRCFLRSIDARLLNSRKLLVRACISCMLCVYAPRQYTNYDIAEPAATLQLKRSELPLRMPLGLGEKSFTINEVLELPNGKPEVSRLLKTQYRTQLQEQRMVGNKAVFKGLLIVHVLYEGSDEALYPYEWSIPFSQYAETERELDECELDTTLAVTSAETEPESQFGTNRLLVSIGLLAQCMAVGVERVALIEDAFCTDAMLTPQWQSWEMDGILDRQVFRETAAAQSDQPAQRVVDAWLLPDEASKLRDAQQMQIELPLSCSILYYDADGKLQGRVLRPTVQLQTQLAENGSCEVTDTDSAELFCSAGSDGLSVRVPISITVESSATHPLRAVCGGEITSLPEQEERRPAVILRLTDSEESVWEIAKSCRTPMQSITEANELQDSTVPAGTLLLIPM